MPAGSGHGFVQLVSCGLRAALFLFFIVRAGRGGAGFRALRDLTAGQIQATQGAALDLQVASPLTHNPWQKSVGSSDPREA